MPFGTSDLRNPICLEMKLLREGAAVVAGGGALDLGSVDSSDTYASCNTQPFNSQADLEDSNLYVNPLGGGVKKSASGGLRSLGGVSPLEEVRKFTGSRGSLDDPPLPKHRKTRFQQGQEVRTGRESEESLEAGKRRKGSFMPSRPLATASRIINHHLFGLHSLGKPPPRGKNGDRGSADSVESPSLQRRSILKKVEAGGGDSETEKLIPERGLKFAPPPPLLICPPPPPRSPTEETTLLHNLLRS